LSNNFALIATKFSKIAISLNTRRWLFDRPLTLTIHKYEGAGDLKYDTLDNKHDISTDIMIADWVGNYCYVR